MLSTVNTTKHLKFYLAFCACLCLVLLSNQCMAQAAGGAGQPYRTVRNPLIDGAISAPPGQMPPVGQPPPVGDGSTPTPEIQGDSNGPNPPPSGQADQTTGSMFPTAPGHDRTIIRLYKQGNGGAAGQSRGDRMVTTIRPDQLSAEQQQKIGGILGINMQSGEQSMDVNVSDSQLEQIQDALSPYPQYSTSGNRKQITQDAPGQGYPKPGEENLYNFQGPLPTVRTFSRYLVILGIVSATIFMAIAAWGTVLGNPYGPSRVIGSATGLILLLMGYTIWKVVQMNTFKANSSSPAINQNRPDEAQVSDGSMQQADTPQAPANAAGGGRSGLPLEPLGASVNR